MEKELIDGKRQKERVREMKKRMRKPAVLWLAAAMMAGSIVGCAGNTSGTAETGEAANASEENEKASVSDDVQDASGGDLLRTDYYEYINGSTLAEKEIPPDSANWSYFYESKEKISRQMAGLMEGMVENAGTYEAGSDEQKITDFYLSALDMESRRAAGLGPFQAYIDEIRAAGSIDEYISAVSKINSEIDETSFAGLEINIDPEDSDRYILMAAGPDTMLTREEYEADDGRVTSLYKEYVTGILKYLGEDGDTAKEYAENIFALQKEIALAGLSTADTFDMSKTVNYYTPDELNAAFPNLGFKKRIEDGGYEDCGRILVTDIGAMEAANAACGEENLEILKAFSCFILCDACAEYADPDLRDLNVEYSNGYLGIKEKSAEEKVALDLVGENFEYEFGYLYGTNYLGEEARTEVESMTRGMIEAYKKRIDALDWMEEATKEEAKKKLETMQIRIGYPDTWKRRTADAVILSPKDGGSLIGNRFALLTELTKAYYKEFREPIDHSEWVISPQTVNACYLPNDNSINFPAGILQAPFYDGEADWAVNLGGIGSVIGHEMSHAFDTNGAQYDEKGNYRDWWTEKDHEHFEELAQEVVNYYDAQIGFEDLYVDGDLTKTENIADISGVNVALTLLGDCGEEELRRFFEAYARVWADKSTDERRKARLKTDVHSPNKVRTNAVISLMDQFYEAYPEIVEGDAMYTVPERRVSIW